MKNLAFFSVFLVLLLLGSLPEVAAQESQNDVVVMLNGDRNEGKVTGITGDVIKFKFKGEDLEYEYKKENINQIEFASGRVQVINETAQAAATDTAPAFEASDPAERQNKVAVLPFEFITNDPSIMVESMGHEIQNACAIALRKNTANVMIQDTRTTNSILSKNNIDATAIASTPPAEMAIMLGVEYVVYGMTNVNNKGTTTSGSGVTTYKDKESKSAENNKRDKKASGSAYSSSNSYTTVNYETKVDLNVYDDTGDAVYANSRSAFGTSLDSYNNAINYMIKRTPFGNKAK